MDRVPAYLLTLVTAVMAVATALMGLTVPSLWSMAGDLGGIKARLEVVDRRLGEFDKRFQEFDGKLEAIVRRLDGIDMRLDGMDRRLQDVDRHLQEHDGKLDAIGRRPDGIDLRTVQRDTDPSNLVAQSGLRPESEFGGVRVGQKLYALPKSDKAQAELAGSGLRREAITPSTFGYVLGTFNPAGRLQPASAAPGATPSTPQ